MKDIVDKLEQVIQISGDSNVNFEQIIKLDEALKSIKDINFIEKPSYVYPQIDTIGRNTYSFLNKK